MCFAAARQVTVKVSSSRTASPSRVTFVKVYVPCSSCTSMAMPLTTGREPRLNGVKPPSQPSTKALMVSFSSAPLISRW